MVIWAYLFLDLFLQGGREENAAEKESCEVFHISYSKSICQHLVFHIYSHSNADTDTDLLNQITFAFERSSSSVSIKGAVR